MQQHGFIHDMLDVKVLILFVASKALYPLSLQKIYELCFQDDCLSYFDVSVAVPQMVESGHLEGRDIAEVLAQDDQKSKLITLELKAPTQTQGRALARAFSRRAEKIFQLVMTELLEEAEGKNNEKL